ncbi:hypothetical protein IWW55_000807 [Coemansia sp. RSA 2706]|nr:hypothetical protein IWW55_000807 [Coemansia sp. RSA 2706]KAJ2717424.1 hypothetical protein H4R23_005318 [Coemansia sp. Cherry 401B]
MSAESTDNSHTTSDLHEASTAATVEQENNQENKRTSSQDKAEPPYDTIQVLGMIENTLLGYALHAKKLGFYRITVYCPSQTAIDAVSEAMQQPDGANWFKVLGEQEEIADDIVRMIRYLGCEVALKKANVQFVTSRIDLIPSMGPRTG